MSTSRGIILLISPSVKRNSPVPIKWNEASPERHATEGENRLAKNERLGSKGIGAVY